MSKFDLRKKATEMRREGLSINDIASKLKISKSTASLWCKHLKLTDAQKLHLKQKTFLAGNHGRLLGAKRNQEKKDAVIKRELQSASEELAVEGKNGLRMMAVGLYWAEGSKTDARFIFTNSDPAMMKIMIHFLEHFMNISRDRFRFTIQINQSHKDRIEEVQRFWTKTLGFGRVHFTNPYFVKTVSRKVYANHSSHFGLVRLRILKSSGLQYRMLGYISVLKEKYMLV